MSSDPVMDEMHRIKDALSAEFNHEVHLLFEHLLRARKTSGRDYVSFAPQIIQEVVLWRRAKIPTERSGSEEH